MTFPVTHSPITSNGSSHKLHHLQPFKISLPEQRGPEQDLVVRVSFHSHVYSQTYDGAATVEAVFPDEAGKRRVFCPVRYASCLLLPGLCENFILNNGLTFESKDRNARNHLAVCDDPSTNGYKYHIYFELLPSSSRGIDVEFVVKSAFDKEYVAAHHRRREHIRRFIKQCHFRQERVPKA